MILRTQDRRSIQLLQSNSAESWHQILLAGDEKTGSSPVSLWRPTHHPCRGHERLLCFFGPTHSDNVSQTRYIMMLKDIQCCMCFIPQRSNRAGNEVGASGAERPGVWAFPPGELDLVKYVALFASTFLTSSGEGADHMVMVLTQKKGVPRDYGTGRTEAQKLLAYSEMRHPKSSYVLMR